MKKLKKIIAIISIIILFMSIQVINNKSYAETNEEKMYNSIHSAASEALAILNKKGVLNNNKLLKENNSIEYLDLFKELHETAKEMAINEKITRGNIETGGKRTKELKEKLEKDKKSYYTDTEFEAAKYNQTSIKTIYQNGLTIINLIETALTYAKDFVPELGPNISGAGKIYQSTYAAVSEALAIINEENLLSSNELLKESNIGRFEVEEGVTLNRKLFVVATEMAKNKEITKKNITAGEKLIEELKEKMEKDKKDSCTDSEFETLHYNETKIKLIYQNGITIINYVKSSLNSAKSFVPTGGSQTIGTIGESSKTLEETIKDADNFLAEGSSGVLNQGNMKTASDLMYNTLLVIGIITAVIMGLVIGIRFMTGSLEEKAEVKKVLITYAAGCVIVFGAFIIWKIVLTIGSGAI